MTPLPFTPRLPPISHQASYLDEFARRAAFALFWEQGTGKTKAIIDNVALLHVEGAVDRAFVLAPNGVHRNWLTEELPKHWPEELPPYAALAWDSEKAGTKRHQEAVAELLRSNSFVWLLMSYDAMMTEAGKRASWDLIRKGRVFYALDESQRVKTPNAARTKRVIASSVYADFRRIASGTPMDTPFDVYSQVRFLDPEFWIREFAIGSFTSFKQHFGEWVKVRLNAGGEFDQLKYYKNLDDLNRALMKIGQRVLKDDVLDLPEKNYKRAFHPLSPAQRRAYDELRGEALTLLDSGVLVTAAMALVRILRLQQITSGFVRPAVGEDIQRFAPNPRAAMFREVLEDLTRPAIVWCQFVEDTAVVEAASRACKRRPVIFNGNRPGDSIDVFLRGEAEDIIGTLSSNMTEGYTLNPADSTLYYSNTSKLIRRKQSEDRNHRIGQERPVTYTDFLAEGTLDERNLARLRDKGATAGIVLGDPEDAWLVEGETAASALRELLE